jgi:hypothetical protein
LRYDATERTWVLEIDRPMVGYQYALRWQVPNDEAIQETAGSIQEWHRVLLDFHKTVDATVVDTIDDAAMERFKRLRAELNQEIADNTLQSQRDLLSLGKRIDEMRTDPQDQEAIKQFDLLYKALEREAYQGRSDERWFAALFIYDTDKMALRPVLSRRSWTEEILPRNFQVSYGDGVAGAAFQQRRIISWNQRSADRRPVRPEALITPMPLPDPNADPAEMVNILAVPVYHSGMENLRRPPPWAGIGVVTIGSSSYASPIGRTEDGRGRVRLAAQIQLAYIIGALRRPPEAASEA